MLIVEEEEQLSLTFLLRYFCESGDFSQRAWGFFTAGLCRASGTYRM